MKSGSSGSSLSIIDTKPFYGHELISIISEDAGKFSTRLVFQKFEDNSKNFNYATICPYFAYIGDLFEEVIDLIVDIRKEPFNKDAREKLANHPFLNNPPFKKKLLLNFEKPGDVNKIIWFCSQDGIKSDSRVKVAAVEFDLKDDDDWKFV